MDLFSDENFRACVNSGNKGSEDCGSFSPMIKKISALCSNHFTLRPRRAAWYDRLHRVVSEVGERSRMSCLKQKPAVVTDFQSFKKAKANGLRRHEVSICANTRKFRLRKLTSYYTTIWSGKTLKRYRRLGRIPSSVPMLKEKFSITSAPSFVFVSKKGIKKLYPGRVLVRFHQP